MMDYQKPEIVEVELVSEAITTNPDQGDASSIF